MTPPPSAPNRPSPVLLLFLIFPLVGLVVAVGITVANGTAPLPATVLPPTPLPVTVPVIPTPAPIVGAPVLDFALPALDSGELVSLTDYTGRTVFLNFWATWCEPCKRELPAFEQFTAEQGEDGPVVLAVNTGEDEAIVRAYLEQQGITNLNVLLDPDANVAEQYGVFQIPVTFVIDAAGNVRYPHYGEMTANDLSGYLDALGTAAS